MTSPPPCSNEINEATEVWPEWVWEKMETPLEPGNAVAFGANMPMKKVSQPS
jgi:hypothetical protein